MKKSLAQEVRQKRNISECSPPLTITLFATRPRGQCAACKGSSYTKNEYNFPIRNLMANIFLFDNFFEKSSILWENCEKLFRQHIWQFFRKRRRLVPKINTTFFLSQMRYRIFYYLTVSSKNGSGAQVSFEGNVWNSKRKTLFAPNPQTQSLKPKAVCMRRASSKPFWLPYSQKFRFGTFNRGATKLYFWPWCD